MKTLLALLLITVPYTTLLSQTVADSLRREIRLAEEEKKGMLYAKLAYHYTFNKPDSAFMYIAEAMAHGPTRQQDSTMAILYNLRGIAFDVSGNQDAALASYDTAIHFAQISGLTRIEASALNNIGLIKWNRSEWEEAIDYYIRSVKLFEEVGNLLGIGNTYNNIGIIFRDEKLYDKALEYYRKALAVRKTTGEKMAEAATLNNIGGALMDLGQWDSAKVYLDMSQRIRRQVNDLYGLGRGAHSLALWFREFNLDSTVFYYKVAIGYNRQLGQANGMASNMMNLGSTYMQMGELELAKVYFDSALVLADSLGMKQTVAAVHGNLGFWYEKKGDYKKAFEESRLYTTLNQEIIDLEKAEIIKEIETKYQTEKKEKRILELDKEKVQATLEIERQRTMIILMALVVLLLAISGGFIFYVRKKRTQAKWARRELEYRKQLLDTTVMAQEEERQRIAKDLHDGIVQSLAAIKIGLQNFGRKLKGLEGSRDELEKQITWVDEAAKEARAISHQMMPRSLIEKGLIVAMEDMLQKTLGTNGIAYEYECFISPEERFETSIEIGLYRICQEMVNNILKHSGADHVVVQLLKTKSHLVMHIEDNGKGFSPTGAQSKSGIGLSNIFSRASAVNGEVNYEKARPKGTVANVRVPLT